MASETGVANSVSVKKQETGLEAFASLCGTLVVGLFILMFVFQNFVIPSRSMASTLLVGDHVVGDKSSIAPESEWASWLMPYRELKRGEPVVFYKPTVEADGEQLTLVKRVIGVPGDHIHLKGGVVYLNGVAQNEPQAAQPTAANYDSYRDDFPSLPGALGGPGVTAAWTLELPRHIEKGELVVPPDSYFVMGDNRPDSLDGRYWGFVPKTNIIGRPLFIYWSFEMPEGQDKKTSLVDRVSYAAHVTTHFFDQTRWKRTLRVIR